MVPPYPGRSRRLQSREESRTVGFGHVADLIPAGPFARTGASPTQRHPGNDRSPVARAPRAHGWSLLLTTHFSGGRSTRSTRGTPTGSIPPWLAAGDSAPCLSFLRNGPG